AGFAGPDGQQLAATLAGVQEYQAMAHHGPRAARKAAALFDAPELLTRRGIVGVERFGALAQQRHPAVQGSDLAGAVGLPVVAPSQGLAVGLQVLKVNRAVLLPKCSAGFFVESNHVLPVDAIKVKEHRIAIENGRGTSPAIMVAR